MSSASGSSLHVSSRTVKDIPPLSSADTVRFSKFLLERYGLHFSDNRRTELEHGIRYAFASSACATLDEFYDLISSRWGGTMELDLLVNAVTVSETHFFRDEAQFNALETFILPEIVKRKTSLRTLRIWSAGCASGEEPYSIAMLLRSVIPEIESWSVTVLATDINTNLLERARVGLYGSWAFREKRALQLRNRYFQPKGNRFELSPQIRRMVTFSRLNLADNLYPAFESNTMMMDLIICRNVTIYFPEEVTRQVVSRFYNALVNGGWLIVGHSEPSLEIYKQFQPRNFPNTVVYQRDDNARLQDESFVFPNTAASATSVPVDRSASQPTPTVPRPLLIPKISAEQQPPETTQEEKPEETLAWARELLEFGRGEEALILVEKLLITSPKNVQAWALSGQIHANRGDWAEAEKACRRAIEIDNLTLPAYYTLGLVLQHQKRLDEAVDMIKKVVYLDHTHILGHYALAELYREKGMLSNAQKSLQNALNLLHNLPDEKMIDDSGGITVSRLREAIIRQQQVLNMV